MQATNFHVQLCSNNFVETKKLVPSFRLACLPAFCAEVIEAAKRHENENERFPHQELNCTIMGYAGLTPLKHEQAEEKVNLLRTFGAEVIQVRTASIANPENYINVAARIASERPGAVFMDQFETMANLKAHLANTGPEIWEQTGGR